ncbi:MAG: hypothetical protein KBF19_04545 [Negativicutes bacterium]|nr:hypothetical protein [Negativicutes bacterium]
MITQTLFFIAETFFLCILISMIFVTLFAVISQFRNRKNGWKTLLLLVPFSILVLADSLGAIAGITYIGFQHWIIPGIVALLLNILFGTLIWRTQVH